jgi:hypothetical protein
VSELKLDDIGIMTISIDKDNRVFFGVEGQFLRQEMLKLFAGQYKIGYTPKEEQEFMLLSTFGVPADKLRTILNMSNAERNKPGIQTGIPIDSADNQLKDWIYTARQANIELNPDGEELKFALKGDAKLQYPKIKKVMDIYQAQDINTFDLVTGLRGKDY